MTFIRLSEYVPALMYKVSPGASNFTARAIVRNGRPWVPGSSSWPVVATNHVRVVWSAGTVPAACDGVQDSHGRPEVPTSPARHPRTTRLTSTTTACTRTMPSSFRAQRRIKPEPAALRPSPAPGLVVALGAGDAVVTSRILTVEPSTPTTRLARRPLQGARRSPQEPPRRDIQ